MASVLVTLRVTYPHAEREEYRGCETQRTAEHTAHTDNLSYAEDSLACASGWYFSLFTLHFSKLGCTRLHSGIFCREILVRTNLVKFWNKSRGTNWLSLTNNGWPRTSK